MKVTGKIEVVLTLQSVEEVSDLIAILNSINHAKTTFSQDTLAAKIVDRLCSVKGIK